MLPLLAPILAQLVTLSVGDRTEARYIVADERYFEGSTRPFAGLNFGWQRGGIALMYGPSITVRPLESTPREVDLFHAANISATYHWRLSSVVLSESVGYGELNLRVAPLAQSAAVPPTTTDTDPAGGTAGGTAGGAPTGTPGGPTTPTPTQAPSQVRTVNRSVKFGSSVTSLGYQQNLSRQLSLNEQVAYSAAGGIGASAREDYPLVEGLTFGVSGNHVYTWGRPDALSSSLSLRYALASNGNRAGGLFGGELWTHRFGPRTFTTLGGGISITRFSQNDGLVGYGVYPTVLASIGHTTRLAHGILTASLGAFSAPVVDPLRATVDPRVGANSGLGWTRDRFSVNATSAVSFSIAGQKDRGAVDSVGAGAGVAYQLGAGFSVDSGIRAAWQTFQGTTITPASWGAFLGLSFAAQMPLSGGH